MRREPDEQRGWFGRLLESIPAILWSADPETLAFTHVSRAAESILGYPAEEWLDPEFWIGHLHPDDAGIVEQCRASVRARRDHELIYRMIAADGGIVWLRDRVHLIIENGAVVELCGAMFDVTAERNTHEALIQSEETYRLIVQTSPDAIGVHVDGRYIYVNPRFVQLFGASSERELLGRDVFSLLHPDYADIVRERLVQLERGESAPMIREKFVRLDGRMVDVEVMAIPVRFNGVSAVQVVARDISERVQTVERLEALSAGTSDALWEGHLQTNEFWGNDAYRELLGEFTQLDAARASWEMRLHPEDRSRVL
ncbi:MAG TPA: PAS domain S-box protein, partial [Thermoanaerobaculia bacterium]|nr:PAS domain S-box protein [Thermoanaerobaculia bacterium]